MEIPHRWKMNFIVGVGKMPTILSILQWEEYWPTAEYRLEIFISKTRFQIPRIVFNLYILQ